MHDGIELERRGCPTCVVITEPFQATADLTAKMAGMPGYAYVMIPHPISRATADVLRERAEEVAHLVAELLVRTG